VQIIKVKKLIHLSNEFSRDDSGYFVLLGDYSLA